MNKHTVIALDLAKNSIQVAKLNDHHKITLNRAMSPAKAKQWFAQHLPSKVAMEACGTAHHWGRILVEMGHQPILIPPKFVTPFRQTHKTDASDSVAIAEAARRPNMKSVSLKSVDQQSLQSVERIRQHLSDQQVASRNTLRGLLTEFGIAIPKGVAFFHRRMPDALIQAASILPAPLVRQLHTLYQVYLEQVSSLKAAEKERDAYIKSHPTCQALMAFPSIGPVNALGLYLQLGEHGANFSQGREASACIGVTPRQFSTGGKVTMIGIGKKRGNQLLRSTLIQGAVSMTYALTRRPARTPSEVWLVNLMKRAGARKAAVAFANKIIRHAWAYLHHGEDFDWQAHQPLG